MASKMVTYSLFKTQSMLLSTTSRKGQPDAHLHPVQNQEHPLSVSNKQEGPGRWWLTSCWKARASSQCQQQAQRARQMVTYKLLKSQSMLLSATSRASQMVTYKLLKSQSMLLLATSRKGQADGDLQPVQNPEHALVSNKHKGQARCSLTSCSKARACSCQQQAGRASQMLTYKLFKPRACSCQQQAQRASQMLTYNLFKTQSMLLSATSRKGKPDAHLQTVQNPEHALVSNKQEGPARCSLTTCSKPRACSCQQQEPARWWLTSCSQPRACSCQQQEPARWWLTTCSQPRACSCQQQAGRASQMVTYNLFTTQSMLLSATSRKGQPDGDLHPVQNPEHALVSNKQEGPARWWLTTCSKPRACSCQQQAGRASQMVTYTLFKTHSMLLSATSRKGQPDGDLHPVHNPEHALVSNKQEGPVRWWLTSCTKPRACSCQQQAGRASQMVTYSLFTTQSMLLSATSRKGQADGDLQPVQNPEHDLVNNKQEGPARWWLTAYSKPRACSCQQQAGGASQMLTYTLFKTQSMLLSATSRASQMLTYILFKTQSMLLSATVKG